MELKIHFEEGYVLEKGPDGLEKVYDICLSEKEVGMLLKPKRYKLGNERRIYL